MNDYRIPTEAELDELLGEEPRFDLEAVKRRTLSRLEPAPRRSLPLRGLLIAAVVCGLSITALAAVSPISHLFKPQKAQMPEEPLSPPAVEAPEPVPAPVPEPAPSPAPEPEPEPAPEPPVLDTKIVEALELTERQAETLRPAVQDIHQSVQDQDVTMTVLQTLGDAHQIYLTLRFDFPETVPVGEELGFRTMDVLLDGCQSVGCSADILERTDRSVTYLLHITSYADPLTGQAVTLTFSDYGREVWLDGSTIQFPMSAGRTTIITPEGNITADASAEDLAALTAQAEKAETTEDGFTLTYLADGTTLVFYDGAHGLRYLTFFPETGQVLTGEDPTFDMALAGEWTHSWVPDYQDPTLYWEGEAALFEDVPPIRKITLSPFLWQMFIDQWDQYLWERWPKEWDSQLLHSDGTVTELSMGSSFPGKREAMAVAAQTFPEPIDVSDVTALIINGVEFPLN